jgi:hypothetical protein
MMNINVAEVISKVNKSFYEVAGITIKKGSKYYSYVKKTNTLFRTNERVVKNSLGNTSVPMIVVNLEGHILDTNLDLCEECGEPYRDKTHAPYCCVCKSEQ